MGISFDTLGYSKRLKENGVELKQADAHAEAFRDYVMPELVTKADLLATKADLLATMNTLALKMDTQMDALALKMDAQMSAIALKMDAQTLKFTVIVGGIIAAVAGIVLAALPLILK